MGGGKWRYSVKGFTENKYTTIKDDNGNPTVATINGVTGCLLRDIKDPTGNHTSLPGYSRTADLYFRRGNVGTAVVQAALYLEGKKVLDFDWGHDHTNKNGDGKTFTKGTVHVQFYYGSGKKDLSRERDTMKDARYMTKAEIAKYGPILKHFNPNINFGPNGKYFNF